MTELSFGSYFNTRHSLNFVIEHLQSTLVKLDLQFDNVTLDSNDFLKLKSMKKLKHVFYFKHKYANVEEDAAKPSD